MLTVNSVSVKIGAILALKNFTLDIKKGEMISLIGRNGAGKTTLLKSIMGVNKLANGTIKSVSYTHLTLPTIYSV